MISAILLTAGLSSRYGAPKALAQLKDTTVIAHLQHRLCESAVSEIVIALGANAEAIKPYLLNHKKVNVVYNKDYKLGQTSSFRVALQGVSPDADGVLLLPVDYPCIKLETINQLVDAFTQNTCDVLIPTYQEKKGHPPIFGIKLKKEFLQLDDSVGINTIAHHHRDNTLLFPVNDPGVLKTFNTPEEFQEIKSDIA